MVSTRTPAHLARHIDHVDREGYTIIVGAFDAALARELHDDIQRLHGLIWHIDKQSPAQRLLDRDRSHQMLWERA